MHAHNIENKHLVQQQKHLILEERKLNEQKFHFSSSSLLHSLSTPVRIITRTSPQDIISRQTNKDLSFPSGEYAMN